MCGFVCVCVGGGVLLVWVWVCGFVCVSGCGYVCGCAWVCLCVGVGVCYFDGNHGVRSLAYADVCGGHRLVRVVRGEEVTYVVRSA